MSNGGSRGSGAGTARGEGWVSASCGLSCMAHLIKENTQGPPLELALREDGDWCQAGVWCGPGLLGVCGGNTSPVPFLESFPEKKHSISGIFGLPLSHPLPRPSWWFFLTSPLPLPLLSAFLPFFFPFPFLLPLSFFSSWRQALPHGEMAPNQATSEDSTRFYFLFKNLTTCLFLPLSNISLLKTSEK